MEKKKLNIIVENCPQNHKCPAVKVCPVGALSQEGFQAPKIDYEKCINQIEGSDKIICKALISFINDGSHSVFEDLIFAPDDGDIENYKRVFKMVFDKLGHIDHYNMMMSKV